MLKRLLVPIFLILAAVSARADRSWRYDINSAIGPTTVSTQPVSTALPSVTIAAPGAGLRNCLTNVVITSTNPYTPSILDGQTMIFNDMTVSSVTKTTWSWQFQDPLCGTAGNALVLQSTTSTNGTTTKYNYQGFVAR